MRFRARLPNSARRVVPAVYEEKNMADQIDFSAPAELRKWTSLRNERVMSASNVSPYLVLTGTLSECIRAFMAKPASQQHLYEIHTAAQPPLVTAVLQADLIAELTRFRDFLC